MLSTYSIHRIPVSGPGVDRAVAFLIDSVQNKEPTSYRFVNAYTLALADVDHRYRTLLQGDGVNLADGKPLSAYLRRVHDEEFSQVRGPTFFEAVLDADADHDLRHYFLGGSPEVLDALIATISARHPGLTIAGASSPPFRDLTPREQELQDRAIAETAPDIVWVGLGTPKQDFESVRLAARLDVTCIGVGAAFDFLAGTKPVAPALFRRYGLEWAFRLLSEPRRLLWRYFWGNVRFLLVLVKDPAWRRGARSRRP